ncbi:hypothetical protein scyTo_0017246, partial [Scyliorhinus torazame]|nr:hypothetical protein [Scyliorhinus torazame]
LPLMQAPSFEYLIPAAILASSPMKTNNSHHNGTQMAMPCEGALCPETDAFLQTWKHTLREIRGAVLVSGLLQVFLGLAGLQGLTSRHCGPMVLAPLLSIIGLSCYKEAAHFSSSHWGVTALLIFLVVILSQHLRSCYIPIWSWKKSKGFDLLTNFPLFRIFSLLLPVTVLWILCGVLPEGDLLSPYSGGGHRGILRSNGTRLVPWFNIPKPGEWGAPSITIQSTCIGIVMALGTSISSLGCYVMCSKVMGCLHPPRDSCNRGICLEGVGSCIATLLGGIASTSSSVRSLDIFLLALLMMPVIQGGFLAFVLDNTVSGTSEERGLVAHFPGFQSGLEGHHRHPPKDLTDVYQLPSALHKYLCIKFFPFCNLCPSSEPVQEPMAEGEETRDLLPTPEFVASGGEIGVANTPRIVLASAGIEA